MPDVVALYPEIPALVWGEIGGDTLEALVAREGRGVPGPARLARLEQIFHETGRWLRVLRDGSAVEERQLLLEDMIAYVDVRLARISELGPRGRTRNEGGTGRGPGASECSIQCGRATS